SVLGNAGSWEQLHDGIEVEVRPFELKKFSTQIRGLPPLFPASGPWAWCGALMVLPKNGSPLWAQVVVEGQKTVANLNLAWALRPGTLPIVAWFQGSTVGADLHACFGSPYWP